MTGDAGAGRLLGAQLIGTRGAGMSKGVDTYAAVLFHETTVTGVTKLDLSYTPPPGSPWDAVHNGHPNAGQQTSARLRARHPRAGQLIAKPTLLIVCTDNAGRSALGAALARLEQTAQKSRRRLRGCALPEGRGR